MHDRMHNQTKLFDCSEELFFGSMANVSTQEKTEDYYKRLETEVATIIVPDLPLSGMFVTQQIAERLPKKSSLHLGILNSLRNMNLFKIDSSIDVSSNVGGFGIDGPLSTLIGQSMADPKRLVFGIVGDLAAFYDMNALGIRNIGNNVRIMLVNNNGGVEFRLNSEVERQLGDATNEFIAASGHNGSMQAWAESMGFVYIAARTKDEFTNSIDKFCSPSINIYSGPVLFEVFTAMKDEQTAFREIHQANSPNPEEASFDEIVQAPTGGASDSLKTRIKNITPDVAKRVYRKIVRRD